MNKGGIVLLLIVGILLIWLANSGRLQTVWNDLTGVTKPGGGGSGSTGSNTSNQGPGVTQPSGG